MPNSLTDLNDYANTSVEYTDNRPAKVIFDRDTFLITDTVLDITSTSVVVEPSIEVVEVINYGLSNLRYRIEIRNPSADPLTGSSIGWDLLPDGAVVSTVGNQYTVSGINHISDWDLIRQFTWTLPANYATKRLWFLEVSIIYFDQALNTDVTVSWNAYDLDYYYLSAFESSTALAVESKRFARTSAAFTNSFIALCDQGLEKRSPAYLTATSTLFCSGDDRSFASADLRPTATLTAIGQARKVFAPKMLPVVATLVSSPTAISLMYNVTTKGWYSNQPNSIFASDPPYVENPSLNYTITVSVSEGGLGFGSSSSPSVSINGNKSTVNAWLQTIIYYPTSGSTSSTTYSITIEVPGFSQVVKTASLNYVGQGSIATTLYAFTTPGNQTWTPTFAERTYGRMDIFLVGGGGGGGSGTTSLFKGYGGAGGGGAVVTQNNLTISLASYDVAVGGGGGRGAGPSNPYANASGYGGGTSFVAGYSAPGGGGGVGGRENRPDGGGSGNGNAGAIGEQRTRNTSTGVYSGGWGGSGGGAGGPALNSGIYTTTPGPGVASNFSGSTVTYSRGGQGTSLEGSGVPSSQYNTTPGSGGYGGGYNNYPGDGLAGVVYIRTHP